jgi:UDP-3-O-[3-hydroxymyristoyl] N-acetylglucosamine deacetylase
VNHQQTLRNRISCSGIGLHGGAKVSLTLHPAAPNTGIVFYRADVHDGEPRIAASFENVTESSLCTTIANADGIRVSTIEHLMAALFGCGIDNALIEVDGPEIPIMDGSAAPFVFLIECAGIVDQGVAREVIRVLRAVESRSGDAVARLSPADGFSVTFEIDYESAAIGHQKCSMALQNGAFKSEICRARTFGFAHEVEALRARGLAQGGSLDNAVVVSGDTVMNDGGLRYRDEFVRHKVLDSVGDLFLAGARLEGHFLGVRSGHALNHQLLRDFFADRSAWRRETAVQAPKSVPATDWDAVRVPIAATA